MDITIVGTGFIGTTLGRALASSGHHVTFGSRHPADDAVGVPDATVASLRDASLDRTSSSWRCRARR